MNKKISVLCCVIGAIALTYGGMNFEFQGIPSPLTAITVSISLALGATMFLYGAYSVFKGNPKTTTANKGEKPMAKTKEKASTSVTLMKREKELETRRKELESLLSEVTKEEQAVEKRLLEKGWVQKDGVWGIE